MVSKVVFTHLRAYSSILFIYVENTENDINVLIKGSIFARLHVDDDGPKLINYCHLGPWTYIQEQSIALVSASGCQGDFPIET